MRNLRTKSSIYFWLLRYPYLISFLAVFFFWLFSLSHVRAEASQPFSVPWKPTKILVTPDQYRHMIVTIEEQGQSEIYYVVTDTDGNTQSVVNVSETKAWSANPDILLINGDMHIVWQDKVNEVYQIFYRVRYNGLWQPVRVLTNSVVGAIQPYFSNYIDSSVSIQWSEINANIQLDFVCTVQDSACKELELVAESVIYSGVSAQSFESTTSQIAYIGENGDLYTINADSSNLKRLTTLGTVQAFSWSSSGQQFIYISEGDLYIIEQDGSNLVRLTRSGDARPFNIIWHDNKIIYIRNYDRISYIDVTDPNYVVHDIAPNLPFYGFGIHSPISWPTLNVSADGRWVSFELYPALGSGIVGIDGSNYRTFDGWEPSWSNNTNQLVHIKESSNGIFALNPETNESVQ